MKTNKRRAIKWGIFALLFAAYIGYGAHRCSEEGDMIVLDFKEFNPPIWDFPFSKDSVVKALYAIAKGAQVFTYHLPHDHDYTNEDSFQFSSYSYNTSSYVYVYRKDFGKRVQEHGELEVTLDSLGPDSTRVIVSRPEVTVGYGVKVWSSLSFRDYFFKYHTVYLPPIQEYDFLRLIGKHLGYLKQMPYTKYPKELSQQQILQRLGKYERADIPFAIEEIFKNPEPGLVPGNGSD